MIRSEAIRSANDELGSLLKLTLANPPTSTDPATLRGWTAYVAQSGARVTVIDATGRVLADSAADPEKMENHANRPNFRTPSRTGQGQSVQRSVTLNRELVYRAARYQPPDPPIVIRLALPLSEINLSVVELRQRLLVATLLMLLLGVAVSLAFRAHVCSARGSSEEFLAAHRRGRFSALPREAPRDELADLADTMNETAERLDRDIRRSAASAIAPARSCAAWWKAWR